MTIPGRALIALALSASACGASRVDARDPQAYAAFVEGALAEERGDPVEAAAGYAEAARLDPGQPEVLAALGRALVAAGRIEEGRAAIDAALAIEPTCEAALRAREGAASPSNDSTDAPTPP